MARDPVSRPVSGEILTSESKSGESGDANERDIVEAEYETIVSRHKAADHAAGGFGSSQSALFDLGILSGNGQETRGGRAGPIFWSGGAALVVAGFWISGGHALVRDYVPVVASEQTNALKIEEVNSRVEGRGPASYLLVDGMVVNSGVDGLPLPDLVIQVKSGDGSISRYRIGGGGETILAGGRYMFSSRLAAPGTGIDNVKVILQDKN